MARPDDSAARPKRRGRRLLFGLIGLVGGLVVALAAIEIVLRVWDPLHAPLEDVRGFYRLDDEGRIETTPGWSGEQIVESKPVPVHMNSIGLRGAEVTPRAAGEKRVLVLGDSYVWGQGVKDDETVPARIEQMLRGSGNIVTVGNAGMFGTGPREWGYTLQRHRATFDPDLVVAVMYVGNDVLDSLLDPLTVYDGWLMTSGTQKLRHSFRFRMRMSFRLWDYGERLFARQKLDDLIAQAFMSQGPGPGFRPDEGVFLDRDPSQDADAPHIARVESVLAGHFASLARAAGDVPVVAVLLPGHEVVLEDYAALLQAFHLEPELHQRGRGHARLRGLLETQGFGVIDLADRFAAVADPKALFLPIDWHFSVAGCRQVAAWLAPEIESRL